MATTIPPGAQPVPTEPPTPGDISSIPNQMPKWWKSIFAPWLSKRIIHGYSTFAQMAADISPQPGSVYWGYTASDDRLWRYANGWKALPFSRGGWEETSGSDYYWYAADPGNGNLNRIGNGNGTFRMRYQIVDNVCMGWAYLQRGSSTTAGNGKYVFRLPATPYNWETTFGSAIVQTPSISMPGTVFGISAGQPYAAIDVVRPKLSFSTTSDTITYKNGSGNNASATFLTGASASLSQATERLAFDTVAWTSGDLIRFNFLFEWQAS